MVKINPNFGYWKTNTGSGGLKTISFNLAIAPSNSFTPVNVPSDYEISYYTTGDNNTIAGVEITNTNGKPFLIIPSTQIAPYISSSAVYIVTPDQPIMVSTTYPESIAAIGENQKFILNDIFSMNSGMYPFPATFFIVD